MLKLSDTHHFRKVLAGSAMALGPALLLVGTLLHPATPAGDSARVGAIAADGGLWMAAHLVLLASVVLVLPAVLGLMHMLRERIAAYGHVGGALALLGLLAFFGLVAIELVVGQMAMSGPRGGAVALLGTISGSAAVTVPFVWGTLAFALGMSVLGLGLYEARAVEWWQALGIALAGIALVIAPLLASNVLAIVGAVLLLGGLGSIGITVLRESDADWEHTPVSRGFRPMAGAR